ncbi:MAG: PAS domain S-box protein [Bacteroidales bacterium]
MKNTQNKSASEILRQQAEELLKKKSAGTGPSLSEFEMTKLIYELEVHQIEMEMQNDELQLTKQQAETAADKYSELYDFAPSGYFTLSAEGDIKELNICTSQMLGKERARLINRGFDFFVSSDTRPMFNLFLENLRKSRAKTECEITILPNESSPKKVRLSGIFSSEKDQYRITAIDITESKRIENELKRSETKFRTLYESASDAIFIMNDKVFQSCNTKTETLFGCMQEDIIGHSPAEFSPPLQPDGRPSSEKAAEKIHAALTGSPQFFYWKHQRYDRTLFDAEVSLNNIEINGESCLQAIVRDITAQKLADEALREERWRLECIVEATRAGTWEWNVQTGETVFNEQYAEIVGYTLGELSPNGIKTRETLAHPMDLIHSYELLDQHFSGELPYYDCECRVKHKDGHWVWIHDRGRLVTRTSEGKPLMMFGTHTDISNRKQAEKDQKESENHARALIDAIPDLMFRLSSQGVFLDYKAAKENLAYQAQSILGKNNRDVSPPEFADLVDGKIQQTLLTGQMQNFEYQLSLPSAEIRDFEARMVQSGTDEVITIVRDVTERKKTEAEISLKNEQLLQANAEKDKFFSIIAHDLRSPFNVFLGFTQMLVDELDTFSLKELQKIALSMRNSAFNLFALLENLLEWSRMRRGLIIFEPKSLLLKPAINKSIETALASANKKGILIEYEIPDDIEANADEYMLGSTIRNLVSNAIKFTPEGGKIIISARLVISNTIEISIRDTGIGMDQKMMANLFRLDENTNRKGTEGEASTGLGLIICKEFIEKHEGKLWVESEVGGGSRFYFTIPQSIRETAMI